MSAFRADGVAVEANHLGARNGRAHFLLHALGPDAELLDPSAPTRGAALRRVPLATTAAVAHERAVGVVGIRNLALRALRDVAAVATQHHRREATAIQIKDRLISRSDGALECLAERLRKRAAIARPKLEAQVHDGGGWQQELADALRQGKGRELSLARGLIGDDARSRAPQHHRGAGDSPELERRVDGVIARVALLFVRRLLLLVDHDQADALERCEQRRARSDHDVGHAVEDSPPLVESFAWREGAVQEGNAIPEPRDEPSDDLRGEDDLGHEDDHAVTARERRGCGAQVHLGLAARGYAVEKEAATRAESRGDGPDRDGLGPGRRQVAGAVVVGQGELGRHAAHRARSREHETPARERPRGGRRAARFGEVARGHRSGRERADRRELPRADAHRARERVPAGRFQSEDRFGPLTSRRREAG